MSYNYSVPVVAGQDLSVANTQYKAVAVGGTIAANNTAALGILQNKPQNGEDATLVYLGRSRFLSGGAITAGNRLIVTTSGYVIATTSGSVPVGTALETVSSGGIAEGIFNFSGASTNLA